MSAYFCCSLFRSSPLLHEPYLSCPLTKLNHRQIWSLTLRNTSNCSPRVVVRAIADGLGVVSPDDLSIQNPPLIETKEEGNDEINGVIDGVEDAKSEDRALRPSTRVKKKKEDEYSLENRFKLRNGKEVFFYCIFRTVRFIYLF